MNFEKKYKINFLWEKMAPKLVVFSREKSSKSLKEMFFEKENLSNLFVQKRSSKQCAEYFLK